MMCHLRGKDPILKMPWIEVRKLCNFLQEKFQSVLVNLLSRHSRGCADIKSLKAVKTKRQNLVGSTLIVFRPTAWNIKA